MNFLKSLFNSNKQVINSYSDFWDWFKQQEQKFYQVVKNQGNINKVFFSKLAPKLNQLKDGFWFLTGMYNDNTAELILTADGVIKNIVFVEELVESAPKLSNWKITVLKQSSITNQYGIEMGGYKFDKSNIYFYSTNHNTRPDEIDITIVHQDLNEENENIITNGVYLVLDNFIGELNAVTIIDNIHIINPKDAIEKLIPLEKLKDFLVWREKEFVEKYKGLRNNTENDNYSGLEGTLKNGLPMLAVINMDLLNWDCKASHPWISIIEIKYDGKDNNGMPDSNTYKLLNEIEEDIMTRLKDLDGHLNIGRQTADSVREIYFASIDFRKPSLVLHQIKNKYQHKIELDFDIYKDKYWRSFNHFIL